MAFGTFVNKVLQICLILFFSLAEVKPASEETVLLVLVYSVLLDTMWVTIYLMFRNQVHCMCYSNWRK